MYENNTSYIILLGFPNLHDFNISLFLFLVIVYCVTICGNALIIILVSISESLHSPMYFFITQVSLLDILMSTDILPNLLHVILHNGCSMSLDACLSQFFVFAILETSECLILMAMSYDRYVAICNTLLYNTIINRTFCMRSVTLSWLLSLLMNVMDAIATSKLYFCGPNIVDHFFCDLPPITELSCSDISIFQIQITVLGIIGGISPFTLIIVSYVFIIITIMNIPSISGRQKSFSTCSSHLAVVSIYFGSLFSVYIVPTNGNKSASKALSLLYTVVTPMLNPFIYSLRNKDFKVAFEKIKNGFN